MSGRLVLSNTDLGEGCRESVGDFRHYLYNPHFFEIESFCVGVSSSPRDGQPSAGFRSSHISLEISKFMGSPGI
jgi:hypothetical protein